MRKTVNGEIFGHRTNFSDLESHFSFLSRHTHPKKASSSMLAFLSFIKECFLLIPKENRICREAETPVRRYLLALPRNQRGSGKSTNGKYY
jgi:hypothetical protein